MSVNLAGWCGRCPPCRCSRPRRRRARRWPPAGPSRRPAASSGCRSRPPEVDHQQEEGDQLEDHVEDGHQVRLRLRHCAAPHSHCRPRLPGGPSGSGAVAAALGPAGMGKMPQELVGRQHHRRGDRDHPVAEQGEEIDRRDRQGHALERQQQRPEMPSATSPVSMPAPVTWPTPQKR